MITLTKRQILFDSPHCSKSGGSSSSFSKSGADSRFYVTSKEIIYRPPRDESKWWLCGDSSGLSGDKSGPKLFLGILCA